MNNSYNLFPSQHSTEFITTERIDKLKYLIERNLRIHFGRYVPVERDGVIMIMNRVIQERIQSYEIMEQRVVMYLTNEVRNHYSQNIKHMNWETNYVNSQKQFDMHGNVGRLSSGEIKLRDDFRGSRVGGTLNFHFT